MNEPAPSPAVPAAAEDQEDTMRPLQVALTEAKGYLNRLEQQPVAPTASLAELRRRLDKPLETTGVAGETVLAELCRDVEPGLMGSAGGRFFGWVIGGSLPAALAADWMTSVWDQNAALYACAPAAAVVEEVVGGWLKDLLGIPTQASFALVSGCQMAHLTCLAAARHQLLQAAGWDVEERGLAVAPPIRIFGARCIHGTVLRAIRLLGLGSANIVALPTNRLGQVDYDALAAALGDNSGPAIVVLQAGDINTGAFDDFSKLIPLAKKHRAWVHIDGAFGLWVAASPEFRHLLSGAAEADSWATDGHKWLNVPYDCGLAFVADAAPHRAAMSHRASYLTHSEDARDQMDWNPEWSRRAHGFTVYAVLRQLGRDGVADLVRRCCLHARALVQRIGALPGAQVVSEPMLNQGLVRFLDPRSGASESDHDAYTDHVIAAIGATGEAFFTGSTHEGRRVMRVSVCNWRTCERDVDRAVRAAAEVLGREYRWPLAVGTAGSSLRSE